MPADRAASRRNGGQRKHENEHKTGIGVVVEVIRDRHPANSPSVAKLRRLEILWISFHAAPPHGHLPPSERQSCHSHQSLFERDNADNLLRSRGTAKVISMLMQGDPTSAAPSGRSAVSDFFQRCFRLRSGNFKPKVRAQSRALHLPLRPCFLHRGLARCLSSPMPCYA